MSNTKHSMAGAFDDLPISGDDARVKKRIRKNRTPVTNIDLHSNVLYTHIYIDGKTYFPVTYQGLLDWCSYIENNTIINEPRKLKVLKRQLRRYHYEQQKKAKRAAQIGILPTEDDPAPET